MKRKGKGKEVPGKRFQLAPSGNRECGGGCRVCVVSVVRAVSSSSFLRHKASLLVMLNATQRHPTPETFPSLLLLLLLLLGACPLIATELKSSTLLFIETCHFILM